MRDADVACWSGLRRWHARFGPRSDFATQGFSTTTSVFDVRMTTNLVQKMHNDELRSLSGAKIRGCRLERPIKGTARPRHRRRPTADIDSTNRCLQDSNLRGHCPTPPSLTVLPRQMRGFSKRFRVTLLFLPSVGALAGVTQFSCLVLRRKLAHAILALRRAAELLEEQPEQPNVGLYASEATRQCSSCNERIGQQRDTRMPRSCASMHTRHESTSPSHSAAANHSIAPAGWREPSRPSAVCRSVARRWRRTAPARARVSYYKPLLPSHHHHLIPSPWRPAPPARR